MPKGVKEGRGIGRTAKSQRRIEEKRARRKEKWAKRGKHKFGNRRPAYKRKQGW